MHTPTRTPSQLSERVASEIRAEMARKGISQSNLAVSLGESQSWLSRRTNTGPGRTPLDLNDLERIAAALEVTANDLIVRATGAVVA